MPLIVIRDGGRTPEGFLITMKGEKQIYQIFVHHESINKVEAPPRSYLDRLNDHLDIFREAAEQ
jgi:hypothetical protein